MDALYFYGMDTNDIFLAGHNVGGKILEKYGENPELEVNGLILLGTHFPKRDSIYKPLACATITGDIDGKTTVLDMHEVFNNLRGVVENTYVITGFLNHALS